MELFKQRTGTEMVFIPYKGQAPVVQDLVAGRLQAMFYPPMAQMVGLIKGGKIRALASAAERRLPDLPDVPTFEEAGLRDFEPAGGIALFAPGGTPREIVMRLNREVVQASTTPELENAYSKLALVRATGTPEELMQRQKREFQTWAPLIRKLGIKAQ